MQRHLPLSRLFLAALAPFVLSAAPAPAFDTVHQWVQLPDCNRQMVWFQALNAGQPGPVGHAGMLPLGMRPYASPGFPPAFWGGWFTWSQEGALLTYASGTLGSTTILDPAGAPILDVHGATVLASALDVMVDPMTGDIFAVTLYSGLIFWTPTHTYLLLVGGPPTVYEITDGGAPIAGVRGVTRLAAQVVDLDPSPTVTSSLLLSGALIFNSSKLYLTTTAGSISTSEVLNAGASIPMVRGVLPMGGVADLIALWSNSYVWTGSHVYRLSTGGGVTLSELFAPAGGAITGTWGMARQTEEWNGFGTFPGAATIFVPTKQYFTNTIGPIPVQEVLDPGSTSITSGVSAAGNHSMLHQAGNLSEIFAVYAGGANSNRGTVIAGGQ